MSKVPLTQKRLQTRFIIISALLAGLFLVVSVMATLYVARETLYERATNDNRKALSYKADQIKDRLGFSVDEVRILIGILESQQYLEELNSGEFSKETTKSITEYFTQKIEKLAYFDQLRLLDSQGTEVIRVDNVEGTAYVVPDNDLQDKSAREYVQNVKVLGEGSLYISPISLNREGEQEEIEYPLNPVLRLAVPIFSQEGVYLGAFVANVSYKEIIRGIVSRNNDDLYYIVDSNGYYLFQPDETKEFGGPNDLQTLYKFSSDYYQVYEELILNGKQALVTDEGVYSAIAIDVPHNNVSGKQALMYILHVEPQEHIVMLLSTLASSVGKIASVTFFLLLVVFIVSVKIMFNKNRLQSLVEHDNQFFSNKELAMEEKVEELEKTRSAMLNLLEDIEAERKKALKASTETKKISARLTLATKAAGIGVWELNHTKNKLTWDEQMFALFGVSKKKTKNEQTIWEKLVQEKDQKVVEHGLRQAIKHQDSFNTTIEITTSSGETRWLRYFANVVKMSKKQDTKIIGVCWDVTTEKQVDKAKTEFVSLASHQLRTPLTAINWYTELLMSDDNNQLTKEQKSYIDEIYQGSTRMVSLVNALLNVSRLELGNFAVSPEKTNVSSLVNNIIKEEQPSITQKALSFTKRIAPRVSIPIDQKLFWIVVQNILSNAVKYTPNEGKVFMQAKVIEKGKEFGGKTMTESSWCLTVKDSGYGIPTDQQEKIFSKLFRASNVQQLDTTGTGLGLYIVKAILDQSGGNIWFVSAKGKGTAFYVTIPMTGMKKKTGSKQLEQ